MSNGEHVIVARLCEMCGSLFRHRRTGKKTTCNKCSRIIQGRTTRKHGARAAHDATHNSEYSSWRSMKYRCCSPGSKDYGRYGGSGITVCSEWENDFNRFLLDMGDRPAGTTLDRVDNDKGYCKENCRWASPVQQAINRKNTAYHVYNGETFRVVDLAKLLGISVGATHLRIKRGKL